MIISLLQNKDKVSVPFSFFFHLVFSYSVISSVNWTLVPKKKFFFFGLSKNLFFNSFSDDKKFQFLTKKDFFSDQKKSFWKKTNKVFLDPKYDSIIAHRTSIHKSCWQNTGRWMTSWEFFFDYFFEKMVHEDIYWNKKFFFI